MYSFLATAARATDLSAWSNADIGIVGAAGSGTCDTGTSVYTIKGAGAEIGGTADNFHFSYQGISGDVSVIARVASLTNTSTSAKVGIMIREGLTSSARNVFLMVTPGTGAAFQSRSAVAGASTKVTVTGVTAPRWLKLERRGNVFSGYLSTDGDTWTLVNRVALTMTTEVNLGFAACSRSSTLLTTGVIDNVVVDESGSSTALPWPWTEHTIGAPTDAGVALFDGSYVLANLGADIASTADKLKFVSQSLTGDGTLTLKVSSLTSGTTAPRFGVMMRSSLDANAVNVLVGMTTPNSLVFQSRQTSGGTTAQRATAVTLAFPTWLKLNRSGNTFTASYSTDGTTWTEQGVETLALPSTIQIGAAYSNRSATVWGIGVGDELRLVTAADINGNGLPDVWEIAHFGAIGVNLLADPDGDGLVNYHEWELANDPNTTNASGQHPVLERVSGNLQQGVTGAELSQPLVVQVNDSLSSAPVAGVPVTFLVTDSSALVGSSSAWVNSVTVTTDSSGLAQTHFKLPTRGGNHIVQATIGAGLESGKTTFTAKALAGEAPLLLESSSLGSPSQLGRVDYVGGAFTIAGTGTAILGTADTGHYAWQNLDGDGYIVAKVESFDATDSSSRAGVVIRDSLDANAAQAGVFISPSSGVIFQGRDTAGATATWIRKAGITAPSWILLRRNGNSFSAFYSTDGSVWQAVASPRVITMGSSVKVGLALSTADTVYRSAVFKEVRIAPLADSPWHVADIGTPNMAVIEDYEDDAVLVRAGGANISSTNDKFRYIYQSLPADGRIVARLASQLSSQTTARSGVMVRESLDAAARNLFLGAAPSTGVLLQQRSTVGAGAVSLATQAGSAPVWLKLEKLGRQFDAYTSSDGASWHRLGTQTLDLGSTPLIGLATHSTVTTAHTETLFDSLQVDRFDGARGWNGSYYDGPAFETFRARRRDSAIDATWAAGEAPATGVSTSAYSVRWEADLVPTHTETYTFKTTSQGSVRVIVNGTTVINRWTAHSTSEGSGVLALTAGVPVRIVIEYANLAGSAARVQLRWSSSGQPEETISTNALRPIDTDNDGMADVWETAHSLDPLNSADGALDPDNDGLTNLQEYQLGGDPAVAQDRLPGAVIHEQWNGVAGTTVRSLTESARFFIAPDAKRVLTQLEGPSTPASGFGSRIRGYLIPAVTGAYPFWLTADDTAELWLSPDDNPLNRVQIARVTPINPQILPHSYDGRFEQRSPTITLEAGHAYYFEVLHKNNASNHHVSVAWTRPGASREVISGSYLATYGPSSSDTDDDGLPDTWQALYELDASLSSAARGAYGDADSDGLINLLEYRAGTNPTEADTDDDGYNDYLETLILSDPSTATDLGLSPWIYGDIGDVSGPALAHRTATNAYRLAATGWGMQVHFDDSFRFLHQEVIGNFEFTARIRRPDSSVTGEALIAIRTGLDEDAPAVGLVIRPDGQHVAFVRAAAVADMVTLAEFYPAHVSEAATRDGYWVRLKREGSLIKFFYSVDGYHWTLFTLTTLSLAPECRVGFAATNRLDEPAVRQFTGVHLNTAPAVLPDQDTLPSGVDGTVVSTINGSAGVAVLGSWDDIGTGLMSETVAGTLDYTFTVPADGVHRLSFSVRSPSNPTPNLLFPVELAVDGQFVGRVNLVLPASEDGLVQILTPWIKQGTHTVRLFWDNTLTGRLLRINSLTVESLNLGDDNDANGRPDWLDERLGGLNTVTVSDRDLYVSPVSLDGKARFQGLLQLTADTVPVTVNPAPGFGWYADVPLSETAPVEIRAAFENEGQVEIASLTWTAINLLELPGFATGGHIQVRKGDSLRLTAWPAGATGGAAVVSVLAPGGSSPVAHALVSPQSSAFTQAFSTPGVYTITATYTNPASVTTEAETFTVEVIEAAFSSNPTVGLNNTAITWDNPLISDNVLLEVDQGLILTSLNALPAGGTRFALRTVNLADSYIVARLGEDGPIFGHATVKSTRAVSVANTSINLLSSYADGSKLYGVPIAVNNLTDDTKVEIEIFVAGVTFEDGTILKVLTKKDFDPYGRAYLKFVYPASAPISICHRIHVYEGDTYLGQF